VIRLEHVTLRREGVALLEDVSLEVPTGRALALIGAGGAGKTLILKTICGLLRPDAGRVFVDEDEVTALDEEALMRVRSRIGMVFQNYALFDFMTVGENVAFPLEQLGGVPTDEIQRRSARRLEQVSLPGVGQKLPSELSGGMKKRVCLARAMVHDPPVMLCDDPTAGLDPVTTNRIFALLAQLRAENAATAIIVSHEVEALWRLCDHVVLLEAGRVAFAGTLAEADASPLPGLRAFLKGEDLG
jgi:phospholipid/cholesterol/gamma-HCH transport system ATP-binding protein